MHGQQNTKLWQKDTRIYTTESKFVLINLEIKLVNCTTFGAIFQILTILYKLHFW
jgi:hypothetical protein